MKQEILNNSDRATRTWPQGAATGYGGIHMEEGIQS